MELKKYKLGEILDVTRGASLSGEFYAAEGEYVRLTCGNFDYQNNCFKENKAKDNLYYIGDFKPDFLMKEGDIITPLTEQAIGLLGSTAIIPESGKYIQSQDVAKIVCKEHLLNKDFAFYLISSNLVKQQLSAAAQQTKIRHTSPVALAIYSKSSLLCGIIRSSEKIQFLIVSSFLLHPTARSFLITSPTDVNASSKRKGSCHKDVIFL